MDTEDVNIVEDEKITVTKPKKKPTEKQLQALAKARNHKSIKKEAVKIVKETKQETRKENNFFLYATMGLTVVAAGMIIMNNSKLITESQKYKDIQKQIETVKTPENLIEKQTLEMSKIEEQPLETQSNLQLKKVQKFSNLQLEF